MTKPQKMEVSRRILRLTYQESGATQRMMRKGLKLITHSWAIWGPRDRSRDSMNCRQVPGQRGAVHPVHDEVGQHVPELHQHGPEDRGDEHEGEQPAVAEVPGRGDHHLPDPGGAVGPGIHFPVGEQPQQVQTHQGGAAVEDHGPGVAAQENGPAADPGSRRC